MPEQPHSHRAHPEPVVLEIGEHLGALVLYTDAAAHGCEIEISPTGADGSREHKEVLHRPVGGRPLYAAVFDRIAEGSYTLWSGGVAAARGVEVAGAAITELDWRGSRAPAAPLVPHGH